MKKLFISGMLIMASVLTAQAQTPNPTIPSNVGRGGKLPLPTIKPQKLEPDLALELLDIISATTNVETRVTTIKVSIKVTNKGTAASPASIVVLDIYASDFAGVLDESRTHWQPFGDQYNIPALAQGNSITRFATFTAPDLVKDVTYRSRLRVNPYGAFAELSVTNNWAPEFSTTIR